MNLSTKQKQTHRLREWTYSYQRGRVEGRDRLGVSDWQVYTAVFEIKCLSVKKVGPLDKTGPLSGHFHLLKKKEIIFQTNVPSLASSQERWATTKFTIFSKSLPQWVSQAPTSYVKWGSRMGLGGWREVILYVADCRSKQQFYDSKMKGHLP